MMRHTLALDLDGTICKGNEPVPDGICIAVSRAKSLGWKVVLCSGRRPSRVLPISSQLGLTGTFIASDGAEIVDINGENNIKFPLMRGVIETVFVESLRVGLTPIVPIGEELFAISGNPSIDYFCSFGDPYPIIVERVDFILSERFEISLMYLIAEGAERNLSIFVDDIEARLPVKIRQSAPGFFTVVDKCVSKAAAMEWIKRTENWDEDAILIVVGDGENDIPLMTIADYSFAIGGASARVLDIADEIVPPFELQGAAVAINRAIDRFVAPHR